MGTKLTFLGWFFLKAVFSWIFQHARHLGFAVAFSLHGYELLCLAANALFRAACVCWCHMHIQTLRKLVDLDWDAMETEELNGSVCRCVWDDRGVRSTAQGIQPSSSHGVFSSNHLCQQTSQSPLTAAADARGAAMEYKWRLYNEAGWWCLTCWPFKSGYKFWWICLK